MAELEQWLIALPQPCAGEGRVVWRRKRHRYRSYCSVVKIARLVCAMGSGMLAFLPVLTWVLVHGMQPMPARLALLQAGACVVLLWAALHSLRLGQRLGQAEALAATDPATRLHA